MSNKGWIGVDLDATLAHYESGSGIVEGVGEPIPSMIKRVVAALAVGLEVRIVTARVASTHSPELVASQKKVIKDWLEKQGLPRLRVTAEKDFEMIELWDDRVVRVIPNTGEICPLCLSSTRA